MKTFYGPASAWDLIWETLQCDINSKAFDKELRSQIENAVYEIKEEGNDG